MPARATEGQESVACSSVPRMELGLMWVLETAATSSILLQVCLLSSVRELRQVFSRVCKGLEESIDPFAEGGTHLLLKHTKALHTLQQSNQALSFLARIASSCYDWDGLNACFGTCTGETACGAHLFDCDTGVEFLQFMARPQNLQQHKHRTGKVFHQFT